MSQHEHHCDFDYAAHTPCISQSPRHAREQQEEAQQVREAGIGPVPRILGLLVVVDAPEDFLGREDQRVHFPDCKLEVHGGEFEELPEEARETRARAAGWETGGIGGR